MATCVAIVCGDINGDASHLSRTFLFLSLTFYSLVTLLPSLINDTISFFRSANLTQTQLLLHLLQGFIFHSRVEVRQVWLLEDFILSRRDLLQQHQVCGMATPDLRGSRSQGCSAGLTIGWPLDDPTIVLMSASKVLLLNHSFIIYFFLIQSLTPSTPNLLVTQDPWVYKYLQSLMNVRQQHNPSEFIHHNTTMASSYPPTSSALDNILRHEAIPVRFGSDSTTSLSNALQLTLAGKLLSTKKPSISSMILYASRTWECPNRLMCYDHGNGIFSFEFIHQADVERVISGGPWYISGDLLLITRMDPNLSIEQLPFSETKLWIRCFDLPPKCFNLKCARLIGNGIGMYSDTDLPPEDPTLAPISIRRVPTVRKYLRVKVICSLDVPLKRTQMVEIENSRTRRVEEHFSRLAYERLPVLCFCCGFLGHSVDTCQLAGPILYGDWIRAEKFYRSKPPSPPKNPTRQIQKGESSRTPALVVSTTAELFTNPIPNPDIIQASFQEFRDASELPRSKGKAQLIGSIPYEDHDDSLIPFEESSNRNSPSVKEGPISILGAIPQNNAKPPRAVSSISDSEVGNLSSYFNPSVPHVDLFSPSTNRCLFKSELVHQALSNDPRMEDVSPKELSHIPKELPLFDTSISFTEMLNIPLPVTVIPKDEEDKSKVSVVTRKRASSVKSVETQRARRGRGTPNADSQV